MAKQLIPEELQALIDQYLSDGVLTDKERAVILKKAEGMGLDRDEIDLYLDAEVHKIDQAIDVAVRKQKGKTCPYCGGSVPQLTDKCPHCGEYITAQASEELQEIFDTLEEALVDMKAGKDISRSKATVERYARKAKMYYGSNPKIQKLLGEVESEMADAERKAKSKAKKEGIVGVVTNKWGWVLIEAIVFGILIVGAANKKSEANERLIALEAQMKAHPDYDKPHYEEKSLEYRQIKAAYGKAWDVKKSYENTQRDYTLLGIIVIGATVVLAVIDNKKKK